MCEWFSCVCFFQSGACSHWHIKASWKPYVWEVCSVCLSYPSNPCSLHATYSFLWLMCSLLGMLSTVVIVIVCIYKLQRCHHQKIWENGRTTGGNFSELFKNCFSHVIHASIWLPHCWQSSCVLTNMSVCLCFNVCFHRCFGPVYLSWFC